MLNFNDTATAFKMKSNAQLRKAQWLFKLLRHTWLVNIGKVASSFALGAKLPIKGMVKATVYDQFVGGETIQDCTRIISEMYKHGVYSLLDYSIEGKETEVDFDHTRDKIIDTVRYGSVHEAVPFAVFKVTGIARFALLEKVSAREVLNENEVKEWTRVKERVRAICQHAHDVKLCVLIDAEESWIQLAVDDLAQEMMSHFNREICIVFNTLQMYRHDRLQFLKDSYAEAEKHGYFLGVKLVRGAYMEKENARAEENGYPTPIQPDKESSDRDYDAAVKLCFDNRDRISFVAGSHNEDSCRKLAQMLIDASFPRNDKRIWFSQLYGMSDNLSFNLAKEGFNVVKYLPFGPVNETLPYLIRRAEENSSASGQTSRELLLIEKELIRRKV